MTGSTELEELLEFLYLCPVGLTQINDACDVITMNPAAARMLAVQPEAPDLSTLAGVLEAHAPDLYATITTDLATRGRLLETQRFLVPMDAASTGWMEFQAVRVDIAQVVVAIIDVSEERRLSLREHQLAVELQRAMLGRVDTVDRIETSVTYRTAITELSVGGDWYDVIELPDDRVGLIVGDAVGHSVSAAAVMGQLRNAVRAMAPWCPDPGELLRRADAFAHGIEGAACTTLSYAVLDRSTGALQYASAGHPPSILLRASGEAVLMMEGRGFPLACGISLPGTSATQQLGPGDRVVMFTDGLFERRDEAITDGLDRLLERLQTVRRSTGGLADALADIMGVDHVAEDDTCVLVVTFVPDATGD